MLIQTHIGGLKFVKLYEELYWYTLKLMMDAKTFWPDKIFSYLDIKDPGKVTIYESTTIYSNNEGIIEDHTILGNGALPLRINGNPIGYIIRVPENKQPKAILVEVYGRNRKFSTPFCPGDSSPFSNALIRNGIVHISLNLVDNLKFWGAQGSMKEDLHNEIHESIDYFFQSIKTWDDETHFSFYALLLGNPNLAQHSEEAKKDEDEAKRTLIKILLKERELMQDIFIEQATYLNSPTL